MKVVTWMSHVDHAWRLLTHLQAVCPIGDKLVTQFKLELFILTISLTYSFTCKLFIHFTKACFRFQLVGKSMDSLHPCG